MIFSREKHEDLQAYADLAYIVTVGLKRGLDCTALLKGMERLKTYIDTHDYRTVNNYACIFTSESILLEHDTTSAPEQGQNREHTPPP